MAENEAVKQDETTPHDKFRKAQAERKTERSRKKKPLEEWYELSGDKNHDKGQKIIACARTKTGVIRQYVGRSKEKPDFVKQLQKQNKLKTA